METLHAASTPRRRPNAGPTQLGVLEKRGGGLDKKGGLEKGGGMEKIAGEVAESLWGYAEKMSFGVLCARAHTHTRTHTHAQDRACVPLYAWGPGLRPALRVGTGGAEERLAAGISGAGRVGGWSGWPGGGGPGGMQAGRVGGGWYARSYSPNGCLYSGVKNAL